jgi:hypothetical protein
MLYEEELDCAPHNGKTITWTPNAFLSSLGHDTGFSTSEGFNKEKVHQDWTSYHCQYRCVAGLRMSRGIRGDRSRRRGRPELLAAGSP